MRSPLSLAALLISFLAAAQQPQVLLRASFDNGIHADQARGNPAAAAEDVSTRRVSVRFEDGRAAQMGPDGKLSYESATNIVPRRGAIELGVQPLKSMDDGRNHRLVTIGAPDAPNSLHIWKTAMHNDLRFRIVGDDGKYVEAAFAGAKYSEPGHWHHLLCTWDLDKAWLRMVLDGRLVSQWNGSPVDLKGFPGRIWLGSAPNGLDRAACALDEFRIYDQPLVAGRVSRAYDMFLSEERANILAEWESIDRVSLDLLPEPDTTFVVFTDPHLSEAGVVGPYKHNHRIRKLVDQINLLGPDFVVDLGDTVTTFPGHDDYDVCARMALDVFSNLKMPLHYVAGNHDIGNKLQLTYHGPRNEKFMAPWFINDDNIALYRKWFGREYYSFDHEGIHFICIDNNRLNSGTDEEQKQWAWLEADLEAGKGARLIFLAFHNVPLWVDTDDVGDNNYENVNEPARSRIRELVRRYGIDAVFTGHTHHRISNHLDDTRYLTLPSACFARNFGGNYGIPNIETVWDSARIGYYVCRVYGDQLRVSFVRTYEPIGAPVPLQEGNDAPLSRLLNPRSEEVADASSIAVACPGPPALSRGIWSAALVADGIHAGNLGDRNPEVHCWTSDPHEDGPEEDFLQIELARPVNVSRVELHPRPGPFGFPSKFDIRLSMDGENWTVAASREGFKPQGNGPITLDTQGQPEARFVRLDIHAIKPNPTNIGRAAMAEFSVFDPDGVNHALLDLGAKVTCGTEAGGGKVTIDDNPWDEISQAGVKTAFVQSKGMAWEDIEKSPGTLVVPFATTRAFGMGRPRGVRFIAPITCTNKLYPDEAKRLAAFGRYVSFLASELKGKAAGLCLHPDAGTAADPGRFARVLTAFGEAAKGAVPGMKVFSYGPVLGVEDGRATGISPSLAGASLGDLDGLLVSIPGGASSVGAAVDWLSAKDFACPLLLHLDDDGRAFSAEDLSRAALTCLARGVPFVAGGHAGGMLNRRATPEPPLYAMKALAALLSNASPVRLDTVADIACDAEGVTARAFQTPTGPVIALWQSSAEPVSATVTLKQPGGSAMLVDGLRFTGQAAHIAGNTIAGLQVRDYPLFVKLAR